MRNEKTKKLVLAALFSALTAVATMIILPVPALHGYVNGGDAVVIVGAFLLEPAWGAIAAGLGSALSDLFYGYFIYAPATFIIKGLMALAAGAILRNLRIKKRLVPAILGSITAEIIMIAGYFAYELVIYGLGGAIADVAPNTIQGIFGAFAGTVLFYGLTRIPYVRKNF